MELEIEGEQRRKGKKEGEWELGTEKDGVRDRRRAMKKGKERERMGTREGLMEKFLFSSLFNKTY